MGIHRPTAILAAVVLCGALATPAGACFSGKSVLEPEPRAAS